MEAKAVGRYLRVTSRKARFVLDEIRGKSATDALNMLKFIPNEAATYIRLIVKSAVANAEHNYGMDPETLIISTAFVDQGPTIKRIHPRAMGRAYRILKRTSHITIAVSEDERLKAELANARAHRSGRRVRGGPESSASQPKVSGRSNAGASKKGPDKTPDNNNAANSPEAASTSKE